MLSTVKAIPSSRIRIMSVPLKNTRRLLLQMDLMLLSFQTEGIENNIVVTQNDHLIIVPAMPP